MALLDRHPWLAILALLLGGLVLSWRFPILRTPREARGRYAFWTLVGLGAAACVIVLLLPWGSDGQARAAVSSIGAIMLLLALLRPAGLWDLPSVRDWRLFLGDAGFTVLYCGVGLLIAVGAWFLRFPS